MKKRIIAVLLALGILVAGYEAAGVKTVAVGNDFFEIISVNTRYRVMRDVKTDILYVMSDGSYNSGNFVVMLDTDGMPLTYEEWLNY